MSQRGDAPRRASSLSLSLVGSRHILSAASPIVAREARRPDAPFARQPARRGSFPVNSVVRKWPRPSRRLHQVGRLAGAVLCRSRHTMRPGGSVQLRLGFVLLRRSWSCRMDGFFDLNAAGDEEICCAALFAASQSPVVVVRPARLAAARLIAAHLISLRGSSAPLARPAQFARSFGSPRAFAGQCERDADRRRFVARSFVRKSECARSRGRLRDRSPVAQQQWPTASVEVSESGAVSRATASERASEQTNEQTNERTNR